MVPVAQASSSMYAFIRDVCSFFGNKAEFVENLETNLIKLTSDVATIKSRKADIDRTLETSFSKERNEEYHIVEEQIKGFETKCSSYFCKYQNARSKRQVSPIMLGTSSAEEMIADLNQRTPTILRRKFLTLAKLSEDTIKLQEHVSRVMDQVKLENMVREKKLAVGQVKHNYEIQLPRLGDYVKEVLDLSDSNNRIAIVGPFGVGKTAVIKSLNNQLLDWNVGELDIIIWIDYPTEIISKDKVVEHVQKKIMERLKFDKEESIDQNTTTISTFLHHKKYILLIDNVTSCINLDKVGIQNHHVRGKVVIASRNINNVIENMDGNYKQVKMKKLTDDQAFVFFQNIAGKISDTRIKDTIAPGIVKSCGGVPWIINVVATYLKGKKEESVWNDTKRRLQADTTSACLGIGGISTAFMLAYEELGDYAKKCLLYGALFPSNHIIYEDYLIECWMGERFCYIEHTQMFRASRDHGVTILNDLLAKHLLERCSDKHVTMPVYFRKVALEQTYPGEKNCEIWVCEKNQHVERTNWGTAKRISSIHHQSKLPDCPKSENLHSLILQRKIELETVADTFFDHMKELKVLDLQMTGIKSLPRTVSSLKNLRNLYLNACPHLSCLPPAVGDLMNLELLDISGTSIPWLPEQIKKLVQLRCLRVNFFLKECKLNEKVTEVAEGTNIIRMLENLEELTIENLPCQLESDFVQGWTDIASSIATELATLKKLTTLKFNFPSIRCLENFVSNSESWGNTQTDWGDNTFRLFGFFIGFKETQHPYGSDISGIAAERRLRLSGMENVSSVERVLRQASAFELIGHDGDINFSDFDSKNLGALKLCVFESCKKVRSIVDNSDESGIVILETLEKLHLFDLPLLQSIWLGSAPSGSLSNLIVLTLWGCNELEEVLTPTLLETLTSLKELKVEECSKIVRIIGTKTREGVTIDLSDRLQSVDRVEFVNLPQLQSICEGTVIIRLKSLKDIKIMKCGKLESLCFTLNNAENLEKIVCEEAWWTALSISNELRKHLVSRCQFVAVNQALSNGLNICAPASNLIIRRTCG